MRIQISADVAFVPSPLGRDSFATPDCSARVVAILWTSSRRLYALMAHRNFAEAALEFWPTSFGLGRITSGAIA